MHAQIAIVFAHLASARFGPYTFRRAFTSFPPNIRCHLVLVYLGAGPCIDLHFTISATSAAASTNCSGGPAECNFFFLSFSLGNGCTSRYCDSSINTSPCGRVGIAHLSVPWQRSGGTRIIAFMQILRECSVRWCVQERGRISNVVLSDFRGRASLRAHMMFTFCQNEWISQHLCSEFTQFPLPFPMSKHCIFVKIFLNYGELWTVISSILGDVIAAWNDKN